jgi:NarL family two-component system response regulator LiaR
MEKNHYIRVLIVDDHDLLRAGVMISLADRDDLQIVGEAVDGDEAIALCDQLQPDVVLMDLIMPGMDGVTTIRAIRQRHPMIKFVVLTTFDEAHLVEAALKAGASGYLLKNVSAEELASAIRKAHGGQPVLGPEAVEALKSIKYASETPDFQLTPRELQVLELVVRGLTNRLIANHLSMSYSTAKNHVDRVLRKLGAANRTEAAAIAIRYHLVPPSDPTKR